MHLFLRLLTVALFVATGLLASPPTEATPAKIFPFVHSTEVSGEGPEYTLTTEFVAVRDVTEARVWVEVPEDVAVVEGEAAVELGAVSAGERREVRFRVRASTGGFEATVAARGSDQSQDVDPTLRDSVRVGPPPSTATEPDHDEDTPGEPGSEVDAPDDAGAEVDAAGADEAGGCGCSASPVGSGLGWLAVGLLGARRRRLRR